MLGWDDPEKVSLSTKITSSTSTSNSQKVARLQLASSQNRSSVSYVRETCGGSPLCIDPKRLVTRDFNTPSQAILGLESRGPKSLSSGCHALETRDLTLRCSVRTDKDATAGQRLCEQSFSRATTSNSQESRTLPSTVYHSLSPRRCAKIRQKIRPVLERGVLSS